MSRHCTICQHPQRAEIDTEIAKGELYRNITKRFGMSPAALTRHKAHIADLLKRAEERIENKSLREIGKTVKPEAKAALDIQAELKGVFRRINLLFDACDRWLKDPDNLEQYDIGPRSEDIKVIFCPPGSKVPKKERLHVILGMLEEHGFTIKTWEIKHADPRELVLKTAASLQGQLELVARLTGLLDTSAKVNVGIKVDFATLTDEQLLRISAGEDPRVVIR